MARVRNKEKVVRLVLVALLFVVFFLVLASETKRWGNGHSGLQIEEDAWDTKLEEIFAKEASKHLLLDGIYRIAIDTSDDIYDAPRNVTAVKAPIRTTQNTQSTESEETGYHPRYNENEVEEKIDWNSYDAARSESYRYQCDRAHPVDNIVLLKTHRTGSGTLSNIMYRYGDLNDHLFALPSRKTFDGFWPVKFHSSFLDQKIRNYTKPRFLVNAQLNYAQMKSLMPKDTQFVAMLRNPLHQLESAFVAMEMDLLLGLQNTSDPFAEFLSKPKKLMMDYINKEKKFHFDFNFIKNGMFYELGLEHRHYNNSEEIQLKIKELAGRLDLVLIMDYFDESLVLMKNEFCWELDDVIYFKFHQRPGYQKRTEFNKTMKEQAREWNKADYELYTFFNKTFWERVRDLGPTFHKEVKQLRAKVKEMEDECLDKEQMNLRQNSNDSNIDVPEFVLKKNLTASSLYLCQKMTRSEKEYVSYLREKTMLYIQKTDAQLVKELQAKTLGNLTETAISENETLEATPVTWVER